MWGPTSTQNKSSCSEERLNKIKQKLRQKSDAFVVFALTLLLFLEPASNGEGKTDSDRPAAPAILHPFAGRRIDLSDAFFGIANVRLAPAP